MILTCFEESLRRLKTTELIMNDEKSKNKEAQTNHFEIGGARELSPHILNKNKIPALTSSTSVHSPLKGIDEESKKRINEIKEKLRKPSGADRALKPISEKKLLVGKIKKKFRKLKDIRPKSMEQSEVQSMNERTKKRIEVLYGILKKTSIQPTYDKNKEGKVESDDPLKIVPKFVRKTKRIKPRNTMLSYSPKDIFDNNRVQNEFEFDIDSHQEDRDTIFNFMKKGNVKLGNLIQPHDIFTPNLKRLQENLIPNIVSRNYTESVSVNQFVPFDDGQSVYKTSIMNNDNKNIIKSNFMSLMTFNENNKKMKSDLLTSHFTMGFDSNNNFSESQSNFYKKKSDSDYNNLANKIEYINNILINFKFKNPENVEEKDREAKL